MLDTDTLLSKWKTIFGAVVGVVATLLGLWSGVGYIVDKGQLAATIQLVRPDKSGAQLSGQYLLSWGFLAGSVWLAIFCLGLLAIVIGGFVVVRHRWAKPVIPTTPDAQPLREKHDKLLKEHENICQALEIVVNQIYNASDSRHAPTPRFTFKKVECNFVIRAKGDTKVLQIYEIETAEDVAHFWDVKIAVDEYAAPFEMLSDIHFTAKSLDDANVVHVPVDTHGQVRTVAVFFLPQVEPHEARRFQIEYDCKGWFGELFAKRNTKWTWSYRSADPDDIADVTFTFAFDAGCGHIDCVNVGTPTRGETLKRTQVNGDLIWTYRNERAPVGRLNWALRFSLEA